MHMDNIQILGFRATIDSVGDVLDKINSIRGDDEIIQLLDADSVVASYDIDFVVSFSLEKMRAFSLFSSAVNQKICFFNC